MEDRTDRIIQHLLTVEARQATNDAARWVLTAAIATILEFVMALVRRSVRHDPSVIAPLGHPAELTGVGGYAPLSLWDQRIRASFGFQSGVVLTAEERARVLGTWRQEWESWAEAVDRYGDVLASS